MNIAALLYRTLVSFSQWHNYTRIGSSLNEDCVGKFESDEQMRKSHQLIVMLLAEPRTIGLSRAGDQVHFEGPSLFEMVQSRSDT